MQVLRPSPSLRSLKRRGSGTQSGRRVRARGVPYGPPIPARLMKWPLHYADQPRRKFAKLKYVKHVNGAGSGANAIVTYEFRANGMFDPEVALGGHQPYGFDQLMAQYEHFCVVKATINLELLDVSSGTSQIFMLACYNETGAPGTAFAAGGANGLREMPLVSKTLTPVPGGVRGNERSASLTVDLAKMFGKSPWNIIADVNYQGTDSADPGQDIYFGVVYYSPTAAAIGASNMFKVEITYYAVFTEPKYFTTS